MTLALGVGEADSVDMFMKSAILGIGDALGITLAIELLTGENGSCNTGIFSPVLRGVYGDLLAQELARLGAPTKVIAPMGLTSNEYNPWGFCTSSSPRTGRAR